MSDRDELEEIRQQKIESLKEKTHSGAESDGSGAASEVPNEPIHVSGPDHLAEFVEEYDVVLADFYADWCGPCKMIEPIVEELAAETDAAIAKVDVDVYQSLAAQYQVQGIPTLILFKDGDVARRMTGAQQKPQLQSLIEQHT